MAKLPFEEACEAMRQYLENARTEAEQQLRRLGPNPNPHAAEVSRLNFRIVDLIVQQQACDRFEEEDVHIDGLLLFFTKEKERSSDPTLDSIIATLKSELRALCH
jgi:hypothetical protein